MDVGNAGSRVVFCLIGCVIMGGSTIKLFCVARALINYHWL